MITFELDSEQTLIQETVHAFAKDELAPAARSAEKGGAPAIALRKSHGELGLRHLDLAEAYGGQGATLTTTVLAEEELGWGDAALALALDGGYAGELATSLLSTRHAPTPGTTTALAYAEPRGPATGFGTTARRTDGGFAITGKKGWVLDAERAQRFVVLAQLEGTDGWSGAAAFLVEKTAATTRGIRVGEAQRLLGLGAAQVDDLFLEDCRVGDDALLASGDQLVTSMREVLARVGLKNAARQVGLARASYELALDFTQDRKAFGRPVAHFQANAFTLADMATEIDSARWLVWRAAAAFDQCTTSRPGETELCLAADAIAQAAEVAWRTADRGVQLLGGAGFVQDYLAEKRMRDTKALALVGAPVEWWRLDAAAHHLGHAIEGPLPSASLQPFVL